MESIYCQNAQCTSEIEGRVQLYYCILRLFRWTTVGWPHKIEVQMEQTYLQLEEDEERFRKLQLTDQANFNDKLDTLSVFYCL